MTTQLTGDVPRNYPLIKLIMFSVEFTSIATQQRICYTYAVCVQQTSAVTRGALPKYFALVVLYMLSALNKYLVQSANMQTDKTIYSHRQCGHTIYIYTKMSI